MGFQKWFSPIGAMRSCECVPFKLFKAKTTFSRKKKKKKNKNEEENKNKEKKKMYISFNNNNNLLCIEVLRV